MKSNAWRIIGLAVRLVLLGVLAALTLTAMIGLSLHGHGPGRSYSAPGTLPSTTPGTSTAQPFACASRAV